MPAGRWKVEWGEKEPEDAILTLRATFTKYQKIALTNQETTLYIFNPNSSHGTLPRAGWFSFWDVKVNFLGKPVLCDT